MFVSYTLIIMIERALFRNDFTIFTIGSTLNDDATLLAIGKTPREVEALNAIRALVNTLDACSFAMQAERCTGRPDKRLCTKVFTDILGLACKRVIELEVDFFAAFAMNGQINLTISYNAFTSAFTIDKSTYYIVVGVINILQFGNQAHIVHEAAVVEAPNLGTYRSAIVS